MLVGWKGLRNNSIKHEEKFRKKLFSTKVVIKFSCIKPPDEILVM